MDSDSDKENYFSLYMKKKKSDIQNKANFRSNKRFKNQCSSSQKLKGENKNSSKLLLESSEKRYKNKNTFSFVKSYLINLDNKKKIRHSTKDRKIEKTKIKTERFIKSSNDIKKYAINSPRREHENDDKKENNQKIEKLKNRIFNLMDLINDFENNFIKSKKPLQIKEQFDKIKYKISPKPLILNKDKSKDIKEKINYFNIDKEKEKENNLSKTERLNYIPKEDLLKNKNNKISYVYSKLFEDLNNLNNLDENKNIIYTKRTNGKRQLSAVNPRISSDKNMGIILLNRHKENNINNNNKKTINNNSTFLNLISSNLIIKNELKKVNSNFMKNKSKSMVNKMNINSNSSSNKTLNNKNENMDEKEKKKNIFKRRINYSNFINQKMKQNIIIQRNSGSYLKQNMINKSIINNKSNGCNTCFDANHNDNYVNNLLSKNNKSKSIDRSNLNVVNSVNNLNPLNL